MKISLMKVLMLVVLVGILFGMFPVSAFSLEEDDVFTQVEMDVLEEETEVVDEEKFCEVEEVTEEEFCAEEEVTEKEKAIEQEEEPAKEVAFAEIVALAEADFITVGPDSCDFTDLQSAINSVAAGSEKAVVLMADIITTKTITISSSKEIRLQSGAGGPYKINGNGLKDSVITNNGKLWLENITITGANKSGFYGGGVYNTGTIIMQEGASISGNTSFYSGGGVYNSRNALFTMNGGTISGNATSGSGGGIFNHNNAVFNFNGGTISDNTGEYGGGVFNSGATTNITGGVIFGNETSFWGGGLYNYDLGTVNMSGGEIFGNKTKYNGGGVNNYATFNMTGGTISGNTAGQDGGGVFTKADSWSPGVFNMSGGSISGNTAGQNGGGVRNELGSTFTMEGGDISDNTSNCGKAADSLSGGGGFSNHDRATFILNNGKICGNTSLVNGGGVLTSVGAIFTMNGGEISGNTAINKPGVSNFGGGGVHIASGAFTMNGGSINENIANSGGGGVNNSFGAFAMNSGEISGNETNGHGGGIYLYGGTVDIGGNSVVSNNTAGKTGGGVYTWDYENLSVRDSAVFYGNKAFHFTYEHDPSYHAVYKAKIHDGIWTEPFKQGYNNYDINHNYDNLLRVTFMWNDGTENVYDSVDVKPGAALADENGMPPDPARDRYMFLGWNTEPDGTGTAFYSDTPVDNSITVYAQWKLVYIVTFDTNGGNFLARSETATRIVAPPENTVTNMPFDPRRIDYSFEGWEDIDGNVFTSETIVIEDITVYAQWTPRKTDRVDPPADPGTDPGPGPGPGKVPGKVPGPTSVKYPEVPRTTSPVKAIHQNLPKTGDTVDLIFMFVLFCLSLVGMCVTLYIGTRDYEK